jgi:hypothetical protein
MSVACCSGKITKYTVTINELPAEKSKESHAIANQIVVIKNIRPYRIQSTAHAQARMGSRQNSKRDPKDKRRRSTVTTEYTPHSISNN